MSDARLFIAVALAATACGVPAPTATGPTDDSLQTRIEADRARLQSLDVFEVGELVVLDPEFVASPYVDDELEPRTDPEHQADRLAALVEHAERVTTGELPACALEEAPRALERLSSLQIVEVGDLLLEEAEPEPSCYDLPCADEVERVEAANCERVSRLQAIVDATKGL